ncbi:DNA polymerase III subunit gamma/tau [Corallincola platygyrae]|uniref:DNA-directed DNA polymerase n=1 Tax=Corallincola platygyrae TaxID=1193278 RepID=A0ABW4XTC5_9GAMM
MSYQALARTWRPQTFAQVVGQPHVVQAISNGIEQQRLHHAFLFSGTRGVGKTTIARLLAKSLNCEHGPTATPCGKCASCVEVAQGNFVDLIEIDAASRTKVEDTRELLENVQYRPTRGRFKVYLIDEVHMLSKHSFNALLKTLEEPPPHVKFLLATTDPQKLPITILSRCLQFNLRSLSSEEISGHLANVLSAEQLPFENNALAELARAARGSMRDALSLTDQAIAHGEGNIGYESVCQMLGTVKREQLTQLLDQIVCGDSAGAMAQVALMAQYSPDFDKLLSELADGLHRLALIQHLGEQHGATGVWQEIAPLAKKIAPEMVQLYYRFMLEGKKELPFAPDPQVALQMTLLRCLSFRPEGAERGVSKPLSEPVEKASETRESAKQQTLEVSEPAAMPDAAPGVDSHPEPEATVANEKNINLVENGTEKANPSEAQPVVDKKASPESTGGLAAKGVAPAADSIDEKPNQQLTEPAAVARSFENQNDHAQSEANFSDLPPEALFDDVSDEHDDDQAIELFKEQSHVQLTADAQRGQNLGHASPDVRQELSESTAVSPAITRQAPSAPQQQRTTSESGTSKALAARNILRSRKLNLESGGKKPDGLSAAVLNPEPQQSKPVQASHKVESEAVASANSVQASQTEFSQQRAAVAAVQPVEPIDGEGVPAPAVRNTNPNLLPTDDYWSNLIEQCGFDGIVRQLAVNSVLQRDSANFSLTLVETQKHLATERLQSQLVERLSEVIGETASVSITIGRVPETETPLEIQQRLFAERLANAKQTIYADDSIAYLMSTFDATVDDESIAALP